jgi:large conductance mechanosensitive channel
MSMSSDFKDFAMKGNLIDMAVGVVMGAAFGAVSSAFINGMFMPLVGSIFQIGDMSKFNIELAPATMGADGKEIAAVMFQLGGFISATINFLIVAFIMFMIVRTINNMKKAEAAVPAPPPGPTADQVLLAEIRDALKK